MSQQWNPKSVDIFERVLCYPIGHSKKTYVGEAFSSTLDIPITELPAMIEVDTDELILQGELPKLQYSILVSQERDLPPHILIEIEDSDTQLFWKYYNNDHITREWLEKSPPSERNTFLGTVGRYVVKVIEKVLWKYNRAGYDYLTGARDVHFEYDVTFEQSFFMAQLTHSDSEREAEAS